MQLGWRDWQMIICKRPATPNDHLQETDHSRWSFVRGRPRRDDHLQEAGPSVTTTTRNPPSPPLSPGWHGWRDRRRKRSRRRMRRRRRSKEEEEKKKICRGRADLSKVVQELLTDLKRCQTPKFIKPTPKSSWSEGYNTATLQVVRSWQIWNN